MTIFTSILNMKSVSNISPINISFKKKINLYYYQDYVCPCLHDIFIQNRRYFLTKNYDVCVPQFDLRRHTTFCL